MASVDICCGTGGFLIAAMHKALEELNDYEAPFKKSTLNKISKKLSVTNLILRL